MKRFLAGILAAQLAFPVWAAAQQPAQQPAAPSQAAPKEAMLPGTLKIFILEGQNAINSTAEGIATSPVVEGVILLTRGSSTPAASSLPSVNISAGPPVIGGR